ASFARSAHLAFPHHRKHIGVDRLSQDTARRVLSVCSGLFLIRILQRHHHLSVARRERCVHRAITFILRWRYPKCNEAASTLPLASPSGARDSRLRLYPCSSITAINETVWPNRRLR